MDFINQKYYVYEFSLHQKYARSQLLLNLVWTHSHIVAELANQLADLKQIESSILDRGLLTRAALLHDIGVYSCGGFEWIPDQPASDKPYIQHLVIGPEILQSEGLNGPVVEAARTHAGMGLSDEDIRKFGLDLPPIDFIPTDEISELVSYASKFHSKTPAFRTAEEVENHLEKYGKGKAKRFKNLQKKFGTPDLTELQKRYDPWHKGLSYKIKQLKEPGAITLSSAGISR